MPAAILGFLAPLIPDLLARLPTGKGKRKAAVNFLAPDAESLNNLCDLLEISANSGEPFPPVAQKILAERLRVTVSLIKTTVEAIGDDTPEESK